MPDVHTSPAGLDQLLDGLPADLEAMPRSVLLTLLRSDQRWRWRQGQRVAVEAYVNRLPRLRDDPEAVLDLAFGEALLREERGEGTDLAEYRQRFPAVAESLGQRLAQR